MVSDSILDGVEPKVIARIPSPEELQALRDNANEWTDLCNEVEVVLSRDAEAGVWVGQAQGVMSQAETFNLAAVATISAIILHRTTELALAKERVKALEADRERHLSLLREAKKWLLTGYIETYELGNQIDAAIQQAPRTEEEGRT
jgi:hypothetical protein